MRYTLICAAALASALAQAAPPPDHYRVGTAGELARVCGTQPSDPDAATAIAFCHGVLAGAYGYFVASTPAEDRFICPPNPGPTRTQVATWQLLQIVNGTRVPIAGPAGLPISLSQGQWHNLKVTQQNTGIISMYLNGIPLGTAGYDPGWNTARRYFGLYIDVRDSNGANGPFEVFSDNILVKSLP